MSRARHRPPNRRPRPKRSRPAIAGIRTGPDALHNAIDEALRARHPLAMLELASSIMLLVDPRRRHAEPEGPGRLAGMVGDLASLCEMFLEAAYPQTDALLAVLAQFTPDDALRDRIRRTLVARRAPLPGWLRRLGETEVHRAVELTDELGDGEDILLGVRLPDRFELTAVCYVDHNMGTIVKEAWFSDHPIAEIEASARELDDGDAAGGSAAGRGAAGDGDAAGGSVGAAADGVRAPEPIPLADARARLSDAIAAHDRTHPDHSTDSWPRCRALLEWLLRTMPAGGTGYRRPEWTDQQLQDLLDEFLGSPHGRRLLSVAPEYGEAYAADLISYGYVYGSGDPLRFSPVTVELYLMSARERILAGEDYFAGLPDALRAAIRFAHERRGISRASTEATLGAVDEWEPRFFADAAVDIDAYLFQAVARRVGGMEALRSLDIDPLPDAPLDLAGMPRDIRDRVARIGEMAEAAARNLLGDVDPELPFAIREALRRIASADASIFRRRSSDERTAAALFWIVASGNGLIGYGGHLTVAEALAAFGVTGSVSQRAEPMLRALGLEWRFGDRGLADPRLLTSRARGDLVTVRDRVAARMREEGLEDEGFEDEGFEE